MFRFFLLIKGYYLISVKGFGTERFINLCKVKNIYLWDMIMSHNEYRMKIPVMDYNALDDIVYKTDVKVDILKRYGLPFLFYGRKNKLLSLVFMIFAISLIFVSNLFVWQIEYEGNYTVSSEQLDDFLAKFGVDEGVLKSQIMYESIEKNLRKEFPIIKWCSVALAGNTMYVRLEENTLLNNKENILQEGMYSDIVSETDGVVTNLLVKNGVALVKVGDSVQKGQILVTGAVPIYDDSFNIKTYHYYDANAEVAIKTSIRYEDSLDNVHYVKEYTGRVKQYSYIKIQNKVFQLPVKIDFAYYDTYTCSQQLNLFNRILLPIYYGSDEAREYYLVEKEYTKEEVRKIFNKNLSNYYTSLSEKGVQILEKDVKIEHNAYKWVIRGNFVVIMNHSQKEYRETQQQVENSIQ